jgi:uncharacterized protein with ParB-like and HNH nuclease domain
MSGHDISPSHQNLDGVFASTNYRVDFYQREYKWEKPQVQQLLDDIFFKFDQTYPEKTDRQSGKSLVQEFPWYYLNTFITNEDEGDVYVVDGQQRLTTLSLILIKLRHLAEEFVLSSSLQDWVRSRIAGPSGEGYKFRMGHGKRAEPMEALFEGERPDYDPADRLTAANIISNYEEISDYLDERLFGEEAPEVNFDDAHRLKTFTYYFLYRLVLVRLDVQQTDVPMVFEVINDRGVRLDPHEILKGKLLGRIDKAEVPPYNETWEDYVGTLDAEDEADSFFRTYLKSRFAESRDEGRTFDGDYQRVIYDEPYSSQLPFTQRENRPKAVQGVKEFVREELTYYVDLYRRVQHLANNLDEEFAHVYYNGRLNDMNMQVLLILAACERHDEREDEKIQRVAYEFDRFYTLLQLNNAYDSNRFNDFVYLIRNDIEGADPEGYRDVFEERLLEMINEQRDAEQASPFSYASFRQVGYQNLNTRFLRYFLGRVEKFIANVASPEENNVGESKMYNLVRNTGSVNGHHVEHILSRNDENMSFFEDEEEFEQERNRLGGLLLLRGEDNEKSGPEPYSKKLKTYMNRAGTTNWSQSLNPDVHHNNSGLDRLKEDYNLNVKPYETFDKEALHERTRLLFEMTKIIWS